MLMLSPEAIIGHWALWQVNIQEKMLEYWLIYQPVLFWQCEEELFLKHNLPQHKKDRNLSRIWKVLLYKSYSSPEPQWRSSWQKLALLSHSQTCVECLTCRLMCANTIKCAHISHWKHAPQRLSHDELVEHIMEHIDATITFSRRCNKITTKNWYRISQSGQSMRKISENAFSCKLGFCRKIYCWARTGI